MNKKICFMLITSLLAASVFCESEGEKLFKANYPKDAIPLLEKEIAEGSVNPEIYNYLGLSYYQMQEYEKSVYTFELGLKNPSALTKTLAFNQGNSYYAMKNYVEAAKSYSLAIQEDENFTEALLNRANALLMAGQLKSALSDYESFVEKAPEDPQKDQIALLIEALKEEIARREEEERRLLAEQALLWEPVVDEFPGEENAGDGKSWERIDADRFEKEVAEKDEKNWEKLLEDKDSIMNSRNSEDVVAQENGEDSLQEKPWEHIEREALEEVLIDSLEEPAEWVGLSKEELLEMERIRKETLAEQERIDELLRLEKSREAAAAKAEAERKALEERLAKQKAEDEALKAEVERRRKLLEDVANSLQSDSKNMTSGADNTLEYEAEGELD